MKKNGKNIRNLSILKIFTDIIIQLVRKLFSFLRISNTFIRKHVGVDKLAILFLADSSISQIHQAKI